MSDGQDLRPAGDYSMTPEAASAKLQELNTAYRGTPSTEPPQDANAARARIAALTNDPKFYDRLMRGAVEARTEWNRLNELIAADDGNAGGLIEVVDGISDPSALSRSAREAMFSGLHDHGFPATGREYVDALDRDPENTNRLTEGDGKAARDALERLSKSSRWHDRIFREQDPTAIEQMTRLTSAVALAGQDGKPVTEQVSKYIADVLERHR